MKPSNAGRKTELNGQRVTKRSMSIDEMTARKLAVLGDGNLSKGIRRAAEYAFSQYQSGRLPDYDTWLTDMG